MAKQWFEIYESIKKVDEYQAEMHQFNCTVMIENDMGYWCLKIVYGDDNRTFKHDFLHLDDLEEFLYAAMIGMKIANGIEV